MPETSRQIFVLVFLVNSIIAQGQKPHEIEILSERNLSPADRWVFDVRWASDDSVYLASGKKGALVLDLEEGESPRIFMPAGAGKTGWGYGLLGLSDQYFVAAATAFFIAWRPLPAGEVQADYFEVIVDLDVFEDRLAVVGATKDKDQRFSPDGAVAWVGSLANGLQKLKPIYYSTSGPGARPMDACGVFGLSKIRALRGGSIVLLPGVEPGVYLYSPELKLERTWPTDDLGIDAECGLNDEEMQKLSADLGSRAAWINQRRTVDEILPLPNGPGLVIRRTSANKTFWQLKTLLSDGGVEVVDIPFTGPSADWHLAGDVRQQRIVFLLVELNMKSKSLSRLIVTELRNGDLKHNEDGQPTRHSD